MTRKRNRKKKQGGSLNTVGSDRQLLYGHELRSVSSTGALQVVLVPFSFTRALALADNFQYYRFKKVKVTVLPSMVGTSYSAAIPQSVAVGYEPGPAPDTPPASQNDVMNLSRSVFHGRGQTVNSHLNLGSNDLLADSPIKWYKTIAGTPDAQWEQQGVVYFFAAANTGTSVSFDVLYDYEIEFQGLMVASSTPAVVPVGSSGDPNAMFLYKGARYLRVPEPSNTA